MAKKSHYLMRKSYLRIVEQHEKYYAGCFRIYSGGKERD